MKKRILLFAFTCLIIGQSFAQKNKLFPTISGVSLENKKITIPQDTKGKYTLIGVAYSQKAEEALVTWLQPVFSTFIEKPKGALFQDSYDVNLYFIPMFTGLNQAAMESSMTKAKKSCDKVLQPYFMFYKGEINTYKEWLSLTEKDTPYFFVLNPEGIIIKTLSGKYTDAKMESIEAILE